MESSWPSLLGHELLNRSIQINRESYPWLHVHCNFWISIPKCVSTPNLIYCHWFLLVSLRTTIGLRLRKPWRHKTFDTVNQVRIYLWWLAMNSLILETLWIIFVQAEPSICVFIYALHVLHPVLDEDGDPLPKKAWNLIATCFWKVRKLHLASILMQLLPRTIA